ncbi:MAG: DUF2934 domain-containing protein [Nitrospiraceae bacterium]|nr:DUF2934 domain-containing protein [Nitrospiraceae bacterium]
MSKISVSNRPTPTLSASTSHAGPGSEKTSPAEQAAQRAEAHHDRVAQRAYELYEQRGRQDSRALEDWVNAERQAVDAANNS